ncbi:MAG: hypothetical protein KIS73_12650 [Enhydrobacter sp.]|nr:hypothetical protein [Enhydrobacter sp.]
MKRTFNIRLWFAVVALGLVGVICGASAYWVAEFITRSLLGRESEISQEFFQSIVEVEGDAVFGGPAPENPALREFVRHLVKTPGMMRANIYSADRQVLWSTEKQLVGKTFADNPDLEKALKGERITEINSIDHHKSEYVALQQSGRFIEAYLPIRSTQADYDVIGVIELYKFPTALNVTIDQARQMIWLLAFGAAVLLYLTLFWIVQRGAVEIERQQQQLARLQSFAMIGQLASAIAHSLRNPMAAIRSTAELWRSELPPGRADVAEDVIREVDRMDGYVRDLLSYARPEPSDMQAFDPMTIVDLAVAKRKGALERSRIAVQRTDQRGRRSTSLIDPVLFEHAVTSIVDNAIEAMGDGGTLDIAISEKAKGRQVSIEIADNGPGIPPELLYRVSDSYFTTKSRGLGLGLALARGVIERWNGSLSISSSVSSGTSVTITLETVLHGA